APVGVGSQVSSVTSVTTDTSDVYPTPAYRVITAEGELAEVVDDLSRQASLGVDTETTGLRIAHDRLRLIQIATRDQVYLLDVFAIGALAITEAFTPLFSSTTGPRLILHHSPFDLGWLHHLGLPIPASERLFDTLIAARILGARGSLPHWVREDVLERGERLAGPERYGLGDLVRRHLGQKLPKVHQRPRK